MPNWVDNSINIHNLDKTILIELLQKLEAAKEHDVPWLDPFGFIIDCNIVDDHISIISRTADEPPTDTSQIYSQQYNCLIDIAYVEPLSDERGRLIFEKGFIKAERYGKAWNGEIEESQDFIHQDWFYQDKWDVDMFLGKTNVTHLRKSE